MRRPYIGQDSKQVATKGSRKASWYVFWYEPGGRRRQKSFGPGRAGKAAAARYKDRLTVAIAEGSYASTVAGWSEFHANLLIEVLKQKGKVHAAEVKRSLKHFERIISPSKLSDITTQTIDRFVRKRQLERGSRKGSTISPATVNKDLRNIRLALNVAHEWGFIVSVPRIRFLKEMEREPRFAPMEHIEAMLVAAKQQTKPTIQNVSAEQYWRCLILFPVLTGWRIGQIQAVHRDRLDFKTGRCHSRAETNKGKRDVGLPIPGPLLDELRLLWASFSDYPLCWPAGSRDLYVEFGSLQRNAGIHLPCDDNHEHSPACHVYGFHDLRRSFATYNAAHLSTWQLKSLMQHKSIRTTERYVAMSKQLDNAPEIVTPESLKKRG